ncbi:MAG: peptidase S1 [Deltaproteobacteria bacterium]|nr:peptidase S1 [Deltaproteobacteria bacterium]
MNKKTLVSSLGLVTALAVSGFGGTVVAQQSLTLGGNTANFGRAALRAGFTPDPHRVSIVTGGTINASSLGLGAGCVGFVTRQPDFILNLSGTSSSLRIYAQIPGARASSGTDATLLVNTANGQWRCNDDSYGGANPTVDVPNAGPGQYDIWVGSYVSGSRARGQLMITELSSNHP